MSAIFGELLTFPQQNGSDVQLRVFGDEHYARYETIDGYSAIYDQAAGRYCYADLSGNRYVSTGVPIEQPPPPGIVRHLEESAAVKRAMVEERELLRTQQTQRGPGEVDVRTIGLNRGLLEGRQLSIGKVRGLTILVNFKDISSATTAADVEQLLNAESYTRNGNISSVRSYFLKMSSGKLDYTNTVVGPYTLSHERQFYVDNLLVEEALRLAVDDGLDLTQFDSRREGIVDAINILYAGQSLYQRNMWPHSSSINLRFGPVRTSLYLLTSLGRHAGELSIGTFCHENGHLLCRFPDMYDYGTRDADAIPSAGIGHYCLMGAGNHLDNGLSPSPVCAYLRDLAGWCTSEIDLRVPGNQDARHGSYDTVMKYQTSREGEYFIVENRSRTGFDRAGLANGLAVYHCDIRGSNELQQGTELSHYQCALLQADGQREMENNINRGNPGDLFGAVEGIALSSTSRPNNREWNGRDSGLVLSNISAPGDSITFNVGGTAPSGSASGEQTPNLAIPDNAAGGVASSIRIGASGIVRRIKVSLEIEHPYIGDLQVELHSPTGRRTVLYARQGGSGDNISGNFDSNRPGELTNMVGLPMLGDWTMRVADRAARDVGTLRKWRLELESTSV
jgi:M6 family metalloprotease-like protein